MKPHVVYPAIIVVFLLLPSFDVVNAQWVGTSIPQSSHANLLADSLPPTITALSILSITRTSALFSGIVNPNGSRTTSWFEWSESVIPIRHDSTTPSFVWDNDPYILVSGYTATNLKPNTEYNVRVVAENTYGRVYSGDWFFTTYLTGTFPSITSLPCDSVSTTSGRLRARYNSSGKYAVVLFQWGKTTGYENVQTHSIYTGNDTSDSFASTVLTGLRPGSKYHYRATIQFIDTPIVVYGNDISFMTLTDSNSGGFTTPIQLRNAAGETRVTRFGVHTNATRCIDAGLDETGLPPIPPSESADLRFIDPHPMNGTCFKEGLALDLRRYFNAAQIDTYMVRLQA